MIMEPHACCAPGPTVVPHTSTPAERITSCAKRCATIFTIVLCFILLAAQSPAQSAAPSDETADAASPQSSSSNLPDGPAAQAPATARPHQTKRILGIIPNFRSVSTDDILPPQSVKEKFKTATEDSFDYSSPIIPALLAGYSLARNATPEFGHGGVGYGRYLWHSAVDQTSENYMVEFVFPAVTREDSRYYTLSRGGLMKRAGYALSRAAVTRSDSGHNVFNVSEVIGAGSSAGLSNLYYPSKERTFSNTATTWGLDVGIDAVTFVLKEFWPDVNRSLFHNDQP